MIRNLFMFFLILLATDSQSQDKKQNFRVGVNYGFGSEFKNEDYSYTNQYYKIQLNYVLKKAKWVEYELVLQPEINLETYQLLNPVSVKANEPNLQQQRDPFANLKNIREVVLNIGFLVRKPISTSLSVYFLGSIGPLITDTETERLAKGFAFSDVLAVGIMLHTKHFSFDVRPSFRHLSNAGLHGSNAGFNTKNIEFGIAVPL